MASKSKDDRLGFGLTLVTIGVIWLLFKFNILSFSIIDAIIDLWPLLLVVAGVNLIFNNKSIITFITWVLFLGILIWYGQFGNVSLSGMPERISGEETVSRDHSWESYESAKGEIELDDDIEKGNLKFDLGFGSVYISASSDDDLEYEIPEKITKVYSRTTKKTANVEFEQIEKLFFNWGDNQPMDYDIELPEDVEWDIDINTGAIDAVIDLKDLDVRNLDIDCGAGDIDITYSEDAPLVYTDIDCGATEVSLNVPQEAGVEISMDGLVSENNFLSNGLVKVSDDIYRSEDFEKSDIKLFIEIDTGVGDIILNTY